MLICPQFLNKILIILLFILNSFVLFDGTLYAQTPESYFPSQVGNVWRYQDFSKSSWLDWQITRDSSTNDGSRYLFDGDVPMYRMDTLFNVYQVYDNGTQDYLYNLNADSGESWVYYRDSGGNPYEYGWVFSEDTGNVFGTPTKIKKMRYGPISPDSGGNSFYFEERYLASGFGLVWYWEEPGDVTYLVGCKIGGDTFGSITTVTNTIRNTVPNVQLLPNYPNPFNPTTTINYDLPEDVNVTITIYDITGREVKTLVNQFEQAGYKSISFDASSYSSGVYFYKLTAGNFSDKKKMVLLK